MKEQYWGKKQVPKCLNALYIRQLEIEVTISNTTIFVKFSWGVVVVCFLGFFSMANF